MTEEKREVVQVLLANRLYIYSLLHKVFGRDPDKELLELLTAETAGEAFALLSNEEGDVMGKTANFLAEVRKDIEDPEFVSSAKSEYTRLFVGPIKLVAPPWESIYRGKEAMLFQESTLEVRNYYRSFGMIPEGYPHVADDSLALEMAFMAELAKRAAEAFEANDAAELKRNLVGADIFLEEHLLVWIPKFLERMKDAPTDILYPQMCLILDSFIKQDHEVLCEVLRQIEE